MKSSEIKKRNRSMLFCALIEIFGFACGETTVEFDPVFEQIHSGCPYLSCDEKSCTDLDTQALRCSVCICCSCRSDCVPLCQAEENNINSNLNESSNANANGI